jgi:hypothetical protein
MSCSAQSLALLSAIALAVSQVVLSTGPLPKLPFHRLSKTAASGLFLPNLGILLPNRKWPTSALLSSKCARSDLNEDLNERVNAEQAPHEPLSPRQAVTGHWIASNTVDTLIASSTEPNVPCAFSTAKIAAWRGRLGYSCHSPKSRMPQWILGNHTSQKRPATRASGDD